MKIQKIYELFLIGTPIFLSTSCSIAQPIKTNINDNINYNDYLNSNEFLDIFNVLKTNNPNVNENELAIATCEKSNQFGAQFWKTWIESLGDKKDWTLNENKKYVNLFCENPRQALQLYTNCFGHFWNIALHKNEIPNNSWVEKRFFEFAGDDMISKVKDTNEIRGEDYKFLDNILNYSSAVAPLNLIVYHGVEFMENEFKSMLGFSDNEKVNFDLIKEGTIIQNYGFLSTTTDYINAVKYSAGHNWVHDTFEPPLGEPCIFKIRIPHLSKGVAYVSGFDINNNFSDEDAQILIKRNSKFRIDKVTKIEDKNILEMTMIE